MGQGPRIGAAGGADGGPHRARRRHRDRADRRRAVGGADPPRPRSRHLRRRLALVPHAARRSHRPDRVGHLPALHRPALPELVLSAGLGADPRRRDPALRQRLPLAAAQHGLARPRAVRGVVHRSALRDRPDLARRRRGGAGREPAVLAPARQRQQRRGRDRALPRCRCAAGQQSLAGERARSPPPRRPRSRRSRRPRRSRRRRGGSALDPVDRWRPLRRSSGRCSRGGAPPAEGGEPQPRAPAALGRRPRPSRSPSGP